MIVQPNEYEAVPFFLQSKSKIDCESLLIYILSKNREQEMVFIPICRSGITISGSELVVDKQINKELWLNLGLDWRKNGTVSYLNSCTATISRDAKTSFES